MRRTSLLSMIFMLLALVSAPIVAQQNGDSPLPLPASVESGFTVFFCVGNNGPYADVTAPANYDKAIFKGGKDDLSLTKIGKVMLDHGHYAGPVDIGDNAAPRRVKVKFKDVDTKKKHVTDPIDVVTCPVDATATPTSTATRTATATSVTSTSTVTATASATPTLTYTATLTNTATNTPTLTNTPTSTWAATSTSTPTATIVIGNLDIAFEYNIYNVSGHKLTDFYIYRPSGKRFMHRTCFGSDPAWGDRWFTNPPKFGVGWQTVDMGNYAPPVIVDIMFPESSEVVLFDYHVWFNQLPDFPPQPPVPQPCLNQPRPDWIYTEPPFSLGADVLWEKLDGGFK